MKTVEVNGEKYKVTDNITIKQEFGLPSNTMQYYKIGFWFAVGTTTGASTIFLLGYAVSKFISFIIL